MSTTCELCGVDLRSEASLTDHLAGKKHLRNKQREYNKSLQERSIFVNHLPFHISEQEILQYFLQFGPIERYKFGQQYLIVEFYNRNTAEFLLNKSFIINGTRLVIKKRHIHFVTKDTSETKDISPISYNHVKATCEAETSFDSQLTAFLNAIQLSSAEAKTRYEYVCTHLDNIFSGIFPKCKTYRFGSTQTGLAFKESDLDIYMDIGEIVYDDATCPRAGWSMQKIFRAVKGILYKMHSCVSQIVPIPKAKTPIIKFTYLPTNISCDLSFKNGLGVHNGFLIKYCLSLDDRLKPLMMIIKYWARHFELLGSGKMSTYALIMLVIFYVQQPSINLLPPLMELQKTCTPKYVNGWQVNFDENTNYVPDGSNCTIPELLHNFFTFYSTFEFKGKVICPSSAIAHKEADFKELDHLPSCMSTIKECMETEVNASRLEFCKPICIQDPIELTRNITSSLTPHLLELFQKYCTNGAEVCASSSKNNYTDLFKTLFVPIESTNRKQKTEVITIILAGPFLKVELPRNFETCIDNSNKEQHVSNNWYLLIFNTVKDIFERVLKLEVQILSADKELKQQKIEALSDVHTKEHEQIILQCTGEKCVWRNRKSNQINPESEMNCLEKEILTSDKVIEDFNKKGFHNNMKLDFTCTLQKKLEPPGVVMTLNNQTSDGRIFHEFGGFVKSKVPKIIRAMCVHKQPSKKSLL